MRVAARLLVVATWLVAGGVVGACSSSGGGGGPGGGDAAAGSSTGGSTSSTGGSGSSSSGGSSSGSGGSGSGGSSGSSSGSTSSSGSGSSSGADAGHAIPTCAETCSAPADCATAGIALYDASHYACSGGFCAWLGCQSNADCTAAYQKPNYACGTVPGVPFPTCYETCSAPADCATAGIALYSASHYACTSGRCDWLGCQSNADCTSAYQKPNYACGTVPGVPYPTCYETCSAPADCATAGIALYSASHWACDTGRCDYLGCQASGECTAAYQKPNYACH